MEAVIPAQVVESTWTEFASLGADQARRRAEATARAQPDLLAFVLALTEELSPSAQELAIYVYHVIWEVFRRSTPRKIRRVKAGAVERQWVQNSQELERLAGAHSRFFEKAARDKTASQPFVFRYMVEAIMEAGEDPDDPIELTKEEEGTLFLVLKTVIDLLHEQRARMGGRAQRA